MNFITLDYVNDIVLVPELSPIKNCHALYNLRPGLWALAGTVRLEEVRRFTSPIKFAITFDERDNLIACYFHWFATSLLNYVRLVGFIDVMSKNRWTVESLQDKERKKKVKENCKRYIEGIPEVQKVLKWRNKIAAHFAATDPWEQDNIATLQDSIQHPITYSRPYYYAHLHVFGLGECESVIPEWSLTETFEALSSRYWPDCKLQQFAE
jgi:hypothetical protein